MGFFTRLRRAFRPQRPEYEVLLDRLADIQIKLGHIEPSTWAFIRQSIERHGVETPERACAQMAATYVLRNAASRLYAAGDIAPLSPAVN